MGKVYEKDKMELLVSLLLLALLTDHQMERQNTILPGMACYSWRRCITPRLWMVMCLIRGTLLFVGSLNALVCFINSIKCSAWVPALLLAELYLRSSLHGTLEWYTFYCDGAVPPHHLMSARNAVILWIETAGRIRRCYRKSKRIWEAKTLYNFTGA